MLSLSLFKIGTHRPRNIYLAKPTIDYYFLANSCRPTIHVGNKRRRCYPWECAMLEELRS